MTNNQNCFCVLTTDVATAVEDAMKLGGLVTVVMRHAERPPLELGDMTFGRDLPLTDKGARDADRLGARLSALCPGCDISFFYGESLRCLMTAERMARQIEGATLALVAASFLGGESPYLANVNERLALANVGNYTDSLNAYFATGRQRGFNEHHSATAAFATSLAAMQTTRIGVFVTHDLNVACYAAGIGACRVFSDSSWPAFLSGIVAVKLSSRTPRSSSPTPRSSSTTCPSAPGWESSANGEKRNPVSDAQRRVGFASHPRCQFFVFFVINIIIH